MSSEIDVTAPEEGVEGQEDIIEPSENDPVRSEHRVEREAHGISS